MAEQVPELVRRPSRLRALAEVQANAESSAEALDRIARTACRVLDVPVVLVNLVGADQQRFVGCAGVEPWPSMTEMPVTAGFCPFALGAKDAYAFADGRTDPALASNPAIEQLGVVAYAGVPLRTTDGEPVGTLCAIDYQPRVWSQEDLGVLADLAAGVIAELQLLTATRRLARDQARLRALTELSAALVDARTASDVTAAVTRAIDRPPPSSVTVLASGEEVEPGAVAVPLADGAQLAVRFAEDQTLADDERAYLETVAGVAGVALARLHSR